MTTARSRAPIAVAGSHTPSKAATCSVPTPRGNDRRVPAGLRIPAVRSRSRRPVLNAHRSRQRTDLDDVSTSNNAVRASALSDVRVDDRSVEPTPLHRPVRRRQHVQKPGRVVTAGRDGLLGQTALVTHPRTPLRHRRLGRRERTRFGLGHTQIASSRQEPAHRAIELFTVTHTKISRALRCDEPGEQILVDVIDPGAHQLHPQAQPLQPVHDPGR